MAAFEGTVKWWHTNYCFGNFTISDCNRQVNLDFDYEDSNQKVKRMEKLDKLIEELVKFRGELFNAN